MAEIILFFLIASLFGCVYMQIRNVLTYKFKKKIIEMAFSYNMRHLGEGKEDAFEWFSGKHDYNDFVFSFKPLKLRFWFTDEELDKIKS